MGAPAGSRVIPYEGPQDAAVIAIGESPAGRELELGRPFVGRAGTILDEGLARAGFPRREVLIANVVPVRAPHDNFAEHSEADLAWGTELLRSAIERCRSQRLARNLPPPLLVPLGDNPLRVVCGLLPMKSAHSSSSDQSTRDERSRIGAWRGSLIPLTAFGQTAGLYLASETTHSGEVWAHALPTYHPAAVTRRYDWHWMLVNDLKRAQRWIQGKWQEPPRRTWHYSPPTEQWVDQVLYEERLFALDSEQLPAYILGLCSEDEVWSFTWDESARTVLQRLFSAGDVVLAAHNASHDWTFLRQLGFSVRNRIVDTGGLAHILCNALPRSLSPGLTARFTTYPHHKWLADTDPLHYCGLDTASCYDAYWAETKEICDKGLFPVSEHDHALLRHCLAMQWRGVLIDNEARLGALGAARTELDLAEQALVRCAEPIIASRLSSFRTPHLFSRTRQCACCGGGEKKRTQCWSCEGYSAAPGKQDLVALAAKKGITLSGKERKAGLEVLLLHTCAQCSGVGSYTEKLDWKWDGPALNDVLYRGYGLPARSYKGRESRRSDQVEVLLDAAHTTPEQQDFIRLYLRCSSAATELNEMEQLAPDLDGRLHSQFDPWGTGSGRVASRESLLQRGRNMQNIPRKYRNVVIADEGYVLFAPDMNQIEARCIAVLSKEEQLKRWFTEPLDWSASPKHGSVDQHEQLRKLYHQHAIYLSRDQVKRATFAFCYGGEAAQVAIELTKDALSRGEGVIVSQAEVARMHALFYSLLPGVRRWQMESSSEVARTRKLRSITGRHRWWLGYISQNIRSSRVRPTDYVVQQYEKNGVRWSQVLARKTQKEVWSFGPQDMAAWVLAEGLERLERRAEAAGIPYDELLHIHDEVLLQTPLQYSVPFSRLVADALTVDLWGMRFTCDVGQAAPTWKGAKGSEGGIGTAHTAPGAPA